MKTNQKLLLCVPPVFPIKMAVFLVVNLEFGKNAFLRKNPSVVNNNQIIHIQDFFCKNIFYFFVFFVDMDTRNAKSILIYHRASLIQFHLKIKSFVFIMALHFGIGLCNYQTLE